jgi:lysophospholipase L1-like esterase
MSLAGRLVPGIGRVRAQARPFADAWLAANAAALTETGPLWVALGDSMSQGLGAHDISGGWVSQLHAALAADGRPLRLVNLSVTGARISDVLSSQLPRLADLGTRPALVTVLAGANDMVRRSRRPAAVRDYAALLDRLPAGRSVVATLPRRNAAALAVNALIDDAAAAGRIQVAEMRGMTVRAMLSSRAEDLFHPSERGYAMIAAAFRDAVRPMPAA